MGRNSLNAILGGDVPLVIMSRDQVQTVNTIKTLGWVVIASAIAALLLEALLEARRAKRTFGWLLMLGTLVATVAAGFFGLVLWSDTGDFNVGWGLTFTLIVEVLAIVALFLDCGIVRPRRS